MTNNASSILFDGHCAFCRAQAERLRAWSTPARPLELVDFQADGALERFPMLTHAQCMAAMQMVTPSGRVFGGAEAVARLVLTRWWGFFAWGYYLPGVRQLADYAYRAVAKRRYLLAKKKRVIVCDGETCSAHFE